MLELFVEFILFCWLGVCVGGFNISENAFINGNPMDFVFILPHPFMTHSTDSNGSWETSAAYCCWHEPLTPNRPTWWLRRSKFSQPSVSLGRKTCEYFFKRTKTIFCGVYILDYDANKLDVRIQILFLWFWTVVLCAFTCNIIHSLEISVTVALFLWVTLASVCQFFNCTTCRLNWSCFQNRNWP